MNGLSKHSSCHGKTSVLSKVMVIQAIQTMKFIATCTELWKQNEVTPPDVRTATCQQNLASSAEFAVSYQPCQKSCTPKQDTFRQANSKLQGK